MPKALIVKLEKQGKLKKQKVGLTQVEALLKQSMIDLKEAKKIVHIAERATYIMAYMSVLKAGRAFLALQGYVPCDGAQHKTVVDATGEFLGDKYQDLVLHFEIMRRKRNEMTYEAGALMSVSEAEKAFDDAIALTNGILKEVKKQNPQIKLNFGKEFL